MVVKCGGSKSSVVDSRQAEDGNIIKSSITENAKNTIIASTYEREWKSRTLVVGHARAIFS